MDPTLEKHDSITPIHARSLQRKELTDYERSAGDISLLSRSGAKTMTGAAVGLLVESHMHWGESENWRFCDAILRRERKLKRAGIYFVDPSAPYSQGDLTSLGLDRAFAWVGQKRGERRHNRVRYDRRRVRVHDLDVRMRAKGMRGKLGVPEILTRCPIEVYGKDGDEYVY
ncbi:hypothetical protein BT96DRAFT_994001 [Gymnopus androsaceus JB14]|uniref:Uncharacterized protein n=1 Tax=Gymnopus androsaceus JB14 TaxID=1447944 RepID=A0A6A4HNQ5_9AGAR|nr:hypothetical protein BT96DRAFT_994001 [Gymnopus androsaceus JB14]